MPFELTLPRSEDLWFSRLQDWFGVWSIEDAAGEALFQQLQAPTLAQHIREGVLALQAERRSEDSTLLYQVQDGIAVLTISGTLMKATSSFGGPSTVAYRKAIRSAVQNEQVKGILMVIDSPGGTSAGTGDLARDVAAANRQKPVYAFAEDMMASAAYGIGVQAELLLTNQNALVGGMGTYTVVTDSSGAAQEMRIQRHVIKAGAFKGMGTPGTPITEQQLAEFQRTVSAINGEYLDLIAAGRKLDRARVESLADGRVHVGAAAVGLGLADRVATLDEAFSMLRQRVAGKATSTPKGPKSMSTETPAAPPAATLADLKGACPGASSDFLLAQLEAGATLAAAGKAWTAKLQQDLDASQKLLADERAKREAAEQKAKETETRSSAAPKKPEGVVPTKVTHAADDADQDGDAFSLFNERVTELMVKKPTLSRLQAVQAVAAKDPDLHQRYLLETNPSPKARRLISEKAA
jgi:signal peptide peptidase SppA